MIPISEKVFYKLKELGYKDCIEREKISYFEAYNFLCAIGKAIDVYSCIGSYNVRCRFLIYEAEKEVLRHVQKINCKDPESAIKCAIDMIVYKDMFRYDKKRIHGADQTPEP